MCGVINYQLCVGKMALMAEHLKITVTRNHLMNMKQHKQQIRAADETAAFQKPQSLATVGKVNIYVAESFSSGK